MVQAKPFKGSGSTSCIRTSNYSIWFSPLQYWFLPHYCYILRICIIHVCHSHHTYIYSNIHIFIYKYSYIHIYIYHIILCNMYIDDCIPTPSCISCSGSEPKPVLKKKLQLAAAEPQNLVSGLGNTLPQTMIV